MRLATIKKERMEVPAIVSSKGVVLLETINQVENKNWELSLFHIIESGQLTDINQWYVQGGRARLEELPAIPREEIEYAPLYRHPRKIWGIGMNYVTDVTELNDHTSILDPVSFMKPDTTIIGPADHVTLPQHSTRTTAEAELAVIIGKRCINLAEAEVPEVIAGYTTALDMTEADIHAANPRYLSRAKSFDTFFSFGPHFVTKDELPDILHLKVSTGLNGKILHENKVFNTIYRPWSIIAFLSQGMTLLPGDVIITGTPGASVIRDGDIIECHIDGFESLYNPVLRR